MKCAVYAIAKDEEKHVERWMRSAKGAEYLVLVDTGSTDHTIAIAEQLAPELAESGTTVIIAAIDVEPWRFDTARNQSLDFVPKDADWCIALDLDEVLCEGWREAMDEVPGWCTRVRYEYTWSWQEDGSPGLQYLGDKIHDNNPSRRWKNPVHEVLTSTEGFVDSEWVSPKLKIHHHPDAKKARDYLPLLEWAVVEDPSDARNMHYLGREYFYQGRSQEAIDTLRRHLSLPTSTWSAERAKSLRIIAACEVVEGKEAWLLKAVAEAPWMRECWVDLASFYHRQEDWAGCYFAARRALTISYRDLSYLSEASAWGWLPHDLAALASYHLGRIDEAIEDGKAALELAAGSPEEDRLVKNFGWYIAKKELG